MDKLRGEIKGTAMNRRRGRGIVDLILGPLPHEIVNFTLGLETTAGVVVLSRGAQVHAANRHPEDYALCLPHIASVVADPLYLGDDLKNPGNIEFVGRAPSISSFILVAVNVTKDASGRYHVTSFYPVSPTKIQGRREKGFLKIAQKKGGSSV